MILKECYEKDFLPPPEDPRHGALLALDDNDKLLLEGSSCHFRLVRSMMSGEDLYSPANTDIDKEDDYLTKEVTSTPIGKLYQAQLLKDHAMGYHLSKLVTGADENDQFLVIAGIGHLKHYTGVPERLESYLRAMGTTSEEESSEIGVCSSCAALIGSQMLYETYLEDRYGPLKQIVSDAECHDKNTQESDEEDESDEDDDSDDEDDSGEEDDDGPRLRVLNDLYLKQTDLFDKLVMESEIIRGSIFNFAQGSGAFSKPMVDYCYVYDENDENFLIPSVSASSCPSSAKDETREAYNSVGATAASQGNLKKARAIMTHLQYTQEDMDIIGEDHLYNFQGVANPHKVANLQAGEHVLDLGSGLGVDSLLAAHHVTSSGSVLGVDLAARQVSYSKAMAASKGIHHVDFLQGDAEKLCETLGKHGYKKSEFDVCISNGAFCLIPDKEQAFDQVYRALKPGGRMAISTTTIQTPLEEQERSGKKFEWPVCMLMFADLNDIQPMCEDVGFHDVEIVDAESPIEIELDENIFEDDNPERFKIHGKYADQYAYLEEMDMDKLCKIVTVYGRKPLS